MNARRRIIRLSTWVSPTTIDLAVLCLAMAMGFLAGWLARS